MIKTLGALADRLVAAVVPKTTAGACACNDYYYTPCGSLCKLCHANCNCTQVTCSDCIYAWGNCH